MKGLNLYTVSGEFANRGFTLFDMMVRINGHSVFRLINSELRIIYIIETTFEMNISDLYIQSEFDNLEECLKSIDYTINLKSLGK